MSESIKLSFEAPIAELETKMIELKQFSEEQNIDVTSEIENMENKITDLRKQIYENLSALKFS